MRHGAQNDMARAEIVRPTPSYLLVSFQMSHITFHACIRAIHPHATCESTSLPLSTPIPRPQSRPASCGAPGKNAAIGALFHICWCRRLLSSSPSSSSSSSSSPLSIDHYHLSSPWPTPKTVPSPRSRTPLLNLTTASPPPTTRPWTSCPRMKMPLVARPAGNTRKSASAA